MKKVSPATAANVSLILGSSQGNLGDIGVKLIEAAKAIAPDVDVSDR